MNWRNLIFPTGNCTGAYQLTKTAEVRVLQEVRAEMLVNDPLGDLGGMP